MIDISKFFDLLFPIIFASILGVISFILFYLFKSSNVKPSKNVSSVIQYSTKKKIKKKINLVKLEKLTVTLEEKSNDNKKYHKHIEIKNSPEILEDDYSKSPSISTLSPAKPILKNNNEAVFVNEETLNENTWDKIPKDEIEILRSRNSSVVSEIRFETQYNDTKNKLSKNQKKRLKAKLKALDNKKYLPQENNSATYQFDNYELQADDNDSYGSIDHLKSSMDNSTEQDKFIDSNLLDKENDYDEYDFAMDIDKNNKDKANENEEIHQHIILNKENEFKINKLEQELKNYQLENSKLEFKLDDIVAINNKTQQENKHLIKKNTDLECTLNALRNELTTSIQKANGAESRFLRLSTERNQQAMYYESQIEGVKSNNEQLQHMISDKEKIVKNLNGEKFSLNDQLNKKRRENQELETNNKNLTMALKDTDMKLKKLQDEHIKLESKLKLFEIENQKINQSYQTTLQNAGAQEEQQNCLINNLKYHIDDLQNEMKDLKVYVDENEELKLEIKMLKSGNQKNEYSNIPYGQELIESDKLKHFSAVINNANEKLKEKSNQYNMLIESKADSESRLLKLNSDLENKYQRLNSEFQNHLIEIVNLRKCIEELQEKLSKNSESKCNSIKQEPNFDQKDLVVLDRPIENVENQNQVESLNKLDVDNVVSTESNCINKA